jgi:hypothetical protein
MELESIILSALAWFRRPKTTCCPSHVDYRPKTNASILRDTGHTKGRLCTGGIGQGKETKHLNEVNVLIVQE